MAAARGGVPAAVSSRGEGCPAGWWVLACEAVGQEYARAQLAAKLQLPQKYCHVCHLQAGEPLLPGAGGGVQRLLTLPGTCRLANLPPAVPLVRHFLRRLESHYYREQEAEFNASLHEYYAARARHQAEQQRLNQVRLGEAVCCTGAGTGRGLPTPYCQYATRWSSSVVPGATGWHCLLHKVLAVGVCGLVHVIKLNSRG